MSAWQPLYLSLGTWPSTVQQSIVYGTARSCGCANASDQLLLLFFAKASRTVLEEADLREPREVCKGCTRYRRTK